LHIFCTYCSANKSSDAGLLPSIDRYQDLRIRDVFHSATQLGLGFRILSGKYGLLAKDDPIENYDHLLQKNELDVHSELVAAQIRAQNITGISFFSVSVLSDPNVANYHECMSRAALIAGVGFNLVPLSDSYL